MKETDTYSEDAALIGERQAAARALMARPLITARTHPAEFALVRSHAEWLIQRFQRVLGYRLTVADDHARLAKRGLVTEVTRPHTRHTGARFTPRAHTYLALSLAVLLEEPAAVPARTLATRVRSAGREAGVDADPARGLGERRAFCAALTRLVDLGALTEVSGTVADHRADATADPLLRPEHHVLRSVVAHPPHADDTPDTFLAEAVDPDPSGDHAGEIALRRLLAETAVVYREELPDRQRDRLVAHQWRAAAALANLLGVDTEVRAEGVALVSPDEAAPHAAFPSGDPVGQTALALVRHLSGRLHPGRPTTSVPVPEHELETALDTLCAEGTPERAEWARTAGPEIPDPARLRSRVLILLADLGLIRGGPGHRRLTAAAARYGADTDERVLRIQDNDDNSRTHPDETSGADPGAPGAPADPHGDLSRVASVLQAVANEKVSATSGDPGDERDPRNGSD
ncbi:TIGR02678 family protein [Nocardiopsis sp. EMB25]|uniref:TIGR02678 family protein n=1 Tax=Nocardiopsis sp. EMB25 TaxID=2835867 RepID=UPI002283EFC8|nr:TIGR02678 family protein [Nocardiopsis sp. EMB25]MCY9787484.1 TIGR02678 family protein [Nocardiopsis sp. EMB25]